MNLLHKLRNKCLLLITALALIVGASFGLLGLVSNPTSVEASMIKFDKETTVTISNGSFNSFSSSPRYPYTIKDFETIGNKPIDMITGAINISDSVYKDNFEKYGLHEYRNPKGTGSDNYVLMINNKADKQGSLTASNYGYVSKEFTLKANGHYYITVSVNTLDSESSASLYLLQNDQVFENCRIENISTNSAWANYTFFVSTNSYEDANFKFAMRMGAIANKTTGCVLFDELHAAQISKETLNNALNMFDDSTYRYKKFDGKVVETFEFGSTSTPNYFSTSESGTGDKSVIVNGNAMNLSATNSNITYKGKEETLLPNATYKFSINAKIESNLTKGNAFIKLNEILPEDEEYNDFIEGDDTTKRTAKTSNLTFSSKTSNSLNDGYVEYSIFVRTDSRDASKVQFSFGLGDGSEASGKVSFKSFKIERVPYSVYSSTSTGSYVSKMDITESLTLSADEYANFTFDKMQSEKYNGKTGLQYPAEVSSWTKSADNKDEISGVINLAEFDRVKQEYKLPANMPEGFTTANNNNVLMIYNAMQGNHSYTSSTKTLTANKWHKITALVNTQDVGVRGVSVIAKLTSNNNTISVTKATKIDTNSKWQQVNLYIHTASTDATVSVELALNDTGVVFFDNIRLQSADSKDDLTNKYPTLQVAKFAEVDLTDPFITSTSTQNFDTPILFNGKVVSGENIEAGIINLDTANLDNIIDASKIEELKSLTGNRSVLAISARDNDVYYEFTNLIPFNFASASGDNGKYYKLSFDLFTYDIAQNDKEEDQKFDNKVLAQGANVSLTGITNSTFKYLNTTGEWKTYEFYIGLNDTTKSNLVFSLGSAHTGCYGKAFLGNITLNEIGKSLFEQAKGENVLKLDTVEVAPETDPETDNNKGSNFDWQYVPAILTFIAIIIAVVGVFLRRRIKLNKHVKSGKPNYDREDVMINKFRRIAIDQREKEIRTLTKECEELTEIRNNYEGEYKQTLSKLRAIKLANRDGSKRHEVMVVEKEIKHLSKLIARYGVEVNNCESQIEFMKTEAYLVALSKQMYREDIASRNTIRKTQDLSVEAREAILARKHKRQENKRLKQELKAEKIADKQERLQEQYIKIQQQKQQAIEQDEQYAKEKQLKFIQQEQAKLDKQKSRAEAKAKKIAEIERKEQEELDRLAKEKAEQGQVGELNIDKVSVEAEQLLDSEVTNTNVEIDANQVNVETEDSSVEEEDQQSPNVIETNVDANEVDGDNQVENINTNTEAKLNLADDEVDTQNTEQSNEE